MTRYRLDHCYPTSKNLPSQDYATEAEAEAAAAVLAKGGARCVVYAVEVEENVL